MNLLSAFVVQEMKQIGQSLRSHGKVGTLRHKRTRLVDWNVGGAHRLARKRPPIAGRLLDWGDLERGTGLALEIPALCRSGRVSRLSVWQLVSSATREQVFRFPRLFRSRRRSQPHELQQLDNRLERAPAIW